MRIRFRKGAGKQDLAEQEFPVFQSAEWKENSDELYNPGCGWYHVYTFSAQPPADGRPVDEEVWLDESCQAERLALALIDIGAFRAGPLSEAALLHIRQILDFFHRNRKGVLLRVVYDTEGKGMEREPLTISMVERHMEQIGGAIAPYLDDVLVFQGVFVGNWGEMHGSKFLDDSSLCRLIGRLHKVTSGRCFLAVRTPAQWRRILAGPGTDPAVGERLALYNDGIFGSSTDLGTYGTAARAQAGETGSWTRKEELEWQDERMDRTPNGGEILSGEPLKGYRQAAEELARMHVGYLNSIYHPDQLDRWRQETVAEEGCWQGVSGYDYIGRHLGYRFTVRNVTERKNRELDVTVENVGFGNLCQEAECFLVTEHRDGRRVLRHLDADPREWRSGQETVFRLDISRERASGSRLCLMLKRKADGRVIRFANQNAADSILLGEFPDG